VPDLRPGQDGSGNTMNSFIAKRVTRISIYFRRICDDMKLDDPVQGMSDAAELAEQARRLYAEFEAETRERAEFEAENRKLEKE
jgi:hypothetical protein